MITGKMIVKLHASWVHSLKEKRMIVKSLISKLRNKFNVSAAEAGDQDLHQSIVIGIVFIAANAAQADSIMEHIISFVESNTEAELMDVKQETDKLSGEW